MPLLLRLEAFVAIRSVSDTALNHALNRLEKHMLVGLRQEGHQRQHVGHLRSLGRVRLQAVGTSLATAVRFAHLVDTLDVHRVADCATDLE